MAEDRKSALADRLQNRLGSFRAHQKELRDDISAIDNQIYDLETTFLNGCGGTTQRGLHLAVAMAEDRKAALADRLQNRLGSLRAHQKELRDHISAIDNQIYDLETTYLNEYSRKTRIFGGISIWPHEKPIDETRIFSLSSLTSPVYEAGGCEKPAQCVEKEALGPKGTVAYAHAPPHIYGVFEVELSM